MNGAKREKKNQGTLHNRGSGLKAVRVKNRRLAITAAADIVVFVVHLYFLHVVYSSFLFKYVLYVYISVSHYNYDTFEAAINRLRPPLRPDCKEKSGIEVRSEALGEIPEREKRLIKKNSTYDDKRKKGDSLLRDLTGANVFERIIRDEDWDNTAGRGETAV